MEQVIRFVLGEYCAYKSQAKFIKMCMLADKSKKNHDKLSMLESKIITVEAWLDLLNADERFVLEKHLIDELEWPRVIFEYSERWKGEFTRTERSLIGYQANAIKKIIAFCDDNCNEVQKIFKEEIESLSGMGSVS